MKRGWFPDQPVCSPYSHCVCLFDRLASGDGLKALRAKPATINGDAMSNG
jgi:hypothetical protein